MNLLHFINFLLLDNQVKQNEKNYFDVCWSFHEEYEDNPQPLFKPLIKKYPLKYPLENK